MNQDGSCIKMGDEPKVGDEPNEWEMNQINSNTCIGKGNAPKNVHESLSLQCLKEIVQE